MRDPSILSDYLLPCKSEDLKLSRKKPSENSFAVSSKDLSAASNTQRPFRSNSLDDLFWANLVLFSTPIDLLLSFFKTNKFQLLHYDNNTSCFFFFLCIENLNWAKTFKFLWFYSKLFHQDFDHFYTYFLISSLIFHNLNTTYLDYWFNKWSPRVLQVSIIRRFKTIRISLEIAQIIGVEMQFIREPSVETEIIPSGGWIHGFIHDSCSGGRTFFLTVESQPKRFNFVGTKHEAISKKHV